MDEQLAAGEIISTLQSIVASQALELAKAQAIINNRNRTIDALQISLAAYEERDASSAAS